METLKNELGEDEDGVSVNDKLDSLMDIFQPVYDEIVVGDLVFTQYKNGGELNETLSIDVKEILPGYYHLSKDHFRYEITQMCETSSTQPGTLNIDGTCNVKCRMPELSYDNATGTVSILGGWLKVQGSVGYTRCLAFRYIRVIYRGL